LLHLVGDLFELYDDARNYKPLISLLLNLSLNPLTWKIWWPPNNASKWQMGFNSAFKGL